MENIPQWAVLVCGAMLSAIFVIVIVIAGVAIVRYITNMMSTPVPAIHRSRSPHTSVQADELDDETPVLVNYLNHPARRAMAVERERLATGSVITVN